MIYASHMGLERGAKPYLSSDDEGGHESEYTLRVMREGRCVRREAGALSQPGAPLIGSCVAGWRAGEAGAQGRGQPQRCPSTPLNSGNGPIS